jgi:hypothetical protein
MKATMRRVGRSRKRNANKMLNKCFFGGKTEAQQSTENTGTNG